LEEILAGPAKGTVLLVLTYFQLFPMLYPYVKK
jgi:hypothetical protein